jgi:hypothetical protein
MRDKRRAEWGKSRGIDKREGAMAVPVRGRCKVVASRSDSTQQHGSLVC